MSQIPEEQYKLLYKKIAGEINPDENVEFEKWLRDSRDNELVYRRMKDAWDMNPIVPRVKGQELIFDRLSQKVSFDYKTRSVERRYHPAKIWNIWNRAAAVILVLLTFSTTIYFTKDIFTEKKVVQNSNLVVKSNPAGQKTRINLPDGTFCWLNSDSEIRYLSNFSDSSRDIQLVGEAYFEVAKDPNKPFTVHTSTMAVRALGTIFNITSFPEDEKETVVLVEGKIEVKCMDDFYPEIASGEGVQLNRTQGTSNKMNFEVDDYVAWKNGELIMQDLKYEEIFLALERWYGVKITVRGDPVKNLKYNGRFKNQMLVNVLESMKYGHEFDYSIDGKNVEIMFH